MFPHVIRLFSLKEQFVFIYDVLLESVKSGETELNGNNYMIFINKLTSDVDDKGFKLIDKEYQVCWLLKCMMILEGVHVAYPR